MIRIQLYSLVLVSLYTLLLLFVYQGNIWLWGVILIFSFSHIIYKEKLVNRIELKRYLLKNYTFVFLGFASTCCIFYFVFKSFEYYLILPGTLVGMYFWKDLYSFVFNKRQSRS